MRNNRKYTYNYKHHYIYKITCLCGNLKGHYYYGKHSTLKDDALNDGYYVGGVILRNYYKAYPPEIGVTITKEIIEYNDTIESNSTREKQIIGDLWKTDPLCLNRKKGGEGGNGHANKGKVHSKEQTEQHNAFMKDYWKTHKSPRQGVGTIVDCYDDDGELVGRFGTKDLACRVLGVTSIDWGLEKETNKCADHRWRTADSMFSSIDNICVYVKPKKVMPKEAVEKIKKSKEGLTLPQTRTAIIGVDKDGNEKRYDGIVTAAKDVHPENIEAAQKNIQQAAIGKRRSAYERTWRYAV